MDREDIRDQVRMSMPYEATDVDDSIINTLINQGVQEIAVEWTWPFLESTATVSLVADTRTASLPTDYLYGAVLVDDDEDTQLPYMSPVTFFRHVGNDTGNSGANPRGFTVYNDKIYFSPIPSTGDTDRYTLYYYSTPTTLDADTTEPEFNVAFHYILVDYCKWKLYERGGMIENALQSAGIFKTQLGQMREWYGRTMQRSPFLVGDGRPFSRPMRDWNIPPLNQGF